MSNESPDETVVRLAENLDISSVSELKAELTSALDLGSPVVLDPSAVERAKREAQVERVLFKPWKADDLRSIVEAAVD